MKKLFLSCIPLFVAITLLAQPTNDECEKPIVLGDVTNYCSKVGEFSNIDATPSSLITPCFGPVQKDVWFEFIPTKTDVNITVKGAMGIAGVGGTLRYPQVALYSGICTNSFEQICAKANGTSHFVSVYKGGLVVGEKYLIRVQGLNSNVGTFQLCLENYNPPKTPTGDCPSGSILCDKSSFVVQSVTGAGQFNEITTKDAPCFENGGGGNIESNSTWFKWTCDKSGTLTFTLTPLRGEDDLDFVLFELPSGIDNCTGKVMLRCMASGETQGGCKLLGATGLRDGSTDTQEDSGCKAGKDNFLAPLDIVSGKSYALMVNNFTSTRAGFHVEFGGTGTFLGPEALFTSNSTTKKLCYGEKITFTDASKNNGNNIVKWNWDFGSGATPRTKQDNVSAQHDVVYNTPGKRYVVLTLESDKGCQVTYIDTFVVDSCCRTLNKLNFNTVVKNLQCQDILEGSIDLNATSNSQPIKYQWSYGATTPSISGLGTGRYTVTVSNAATCDTIIRFDVTAPPPITADTTITRPTCNGGQNGVITLNPKGGISPYQYNWGAGYTTNNTLANLPIGIYPVFIKDAGGCQKLLSINLKEVDLTLDPAIKAARSPKCFGDKNGEIELKVINGFSPFEYDFGSGYQSSNISTGLGAGTYTVKIRDANLCQGFFSFNLVEPTQLTATLDSTLISCFGAADGQASVTAIGGTPDYSYLWSNNTVESLTSNLRAGNHAVTVTDANGCKLVLPLTLSQPPRLDIDVLGIKNVVCYGDKTGTVTFEGNGGRLPYQYSLDGVIFQKNNTFSNLAAGTYTLFVKDTAGCDFSKNVTIEQPSPIAVNAGTNKTIDLGEDWQINAVVLPLGTPVKSIAWTPDSTLTCKDCLTPTAAPTETTTYTIKVTDVTDCPAIDKITIFVNKQHKAFIPNIFSPLDANGTNDGFTAFAGKAAKEITLMRIFNRWGDLVYEGKNLPLNDTTKGWNGQFKGKQVSPGVYTYYIVVGFIDSASEEFRGDVMVMPE